MTTEMTITIRVTERNGFAINVYDMETTWEKFNKFANVYESILKYAICYTVYMGSTKMVKVIN